MKINIMSITQNFNKDGELMQYRVTYQKFDNEGNMLSSNAMLLLKPDAIGPIEVATQGVQGFVTERINLKEGISTQEENQR
ncbi:hypothetical protein PM3016_5425 [Paenibacillus mucilaginosus 3016]|uniref:Uncharacterized protein n=1 Tax=Paenibacillus mucilaginosus 3016 TaxID=1116391 RepID=H6NDS6_9BACL|nr:hypothetical protein [Paenibacillus mucilaginosus]AFC32125.1 hypothetical protein PM3016_5425 [Paenibacillus mucilaginosus 3016]WFA20628.1 hypothetical protein ERY13_27005 [Paenibacillus mucilaginosus]